MSEYEFKVFMYESELKFLKWLVMQKPKIETGGDLFGLWQDKDTAVVQFILGPGQNCSRTKHSFHQDVEYLANGGQYLTSHEGLCNIGEWHSHHRIGLREPSGGDKNTVWQNLPSVSGGRFLLFIANIEVSFSETSVAVHCFLFNSETNQMSRGKLSPLPASTCSPLRHNLKFNAYLKQGCEEKQDWETFCYDFAHPNASRSWWSIMVKLWSIFSTILSTAWPAAARVDKDSQELDLENAPRSLLCVCEVGDVQLAVPYIGDVHSACEKSPCKNLVRSVFNCFMFGFGLAFGGCFRFCRRCLVKMFGVAITFIRFTL